MRTPLIILVSLATLVGACAPEASDSPAEENGEGAPAATDMEASGTAQASPFDDPEVERIWDRMMAQIAPDDGWKRTRYIQFDWVVSRPDGELRRSHRWDVWGGDYRVEAPMGEERMVALFNVNHPTEGERIWLDGELVEAPRSDSLARRANGMFINDSYWLLMPFKWADPGVHDEYLGEMEQWGETYEVVELTFDSVGLTPQNKYRAFVNPESGVMELWQHFRNADDEDPGFTLAWTDWQDYGPIRLSSRRPDQDGNAPIYFENLRAETSVPEDAFTPPEGAGASSEEAGSSPEEPGASAGEGGADG